jgi:hypothetical protein
VTDEAGKSPGPFVFIRFACRDFLNDPRRLSRPIPAFPFIRKRLFAISGTLGGKGNVSGQFWEESSPRVIHRWPEPRIRLAGDEAALRASESNREAYFNSKGGRQTRQRVLARVEVEFGFLITLHRLERHKNFRAPNLDGLSASNTKNDLFTS